MGKVKGPLSLHWYQRINYRNVSVLVVVLLGIFFVFSPVNFSGNHAFTGNFINTTINEVFLTLGDSFTQKINVTNTYSDTSNISLQITPNGNSFIARFIDHPLAEVSTIANERDYLNSPHMAPLEQRTFEIEVTAVDISQSAEVLDIEGNIVSCIPCPQESFSMTIHTREPLSFPGLGIHAIILLVILSGLVFWRSSGRWI